MPIAQKLPHLLTSKSFRYHMLKSKIVFICLCAFGKKKNGTCFNINHLDFTFAHLVAANQTLRIYKHCILFQYSCLFSCTHRFLKWITIHDDQSYSIYIYIYITLLAYPILKILPLLPREHLSPFS